MSRLFQGLAVIITLIIIGFATVAPASAAQLELSSSQVSPLPAFACDATVYHIKNDKLFRIDVSDGSPTVSETFFDHDRQMNSLGFNPLDNYLYMQDKNKNILRVGANGEHENLGPVSGINAFYFVGDFLRDGTYVLGNGRTLHMVDLSTMSVIRTVNVKYNGGNASYSDIAVSPVDGLVYAKLQNHGNILVTIDMTTGEASSRGPSYRGNSGSVWFDEAGTFYAYSFDDGNFYKIDPSNGSYTIMGNAERPSAHDATSCPYSFGVNLNIDDVACPADFYQEFNITNATNEILSGLSFKQTLPEGFAYAESDSRIETVFANNFGNGVSVSRVGRSLTVSGITADIGETAFQLKVEHDGNDSTTASFRANFEGLPSLYGSIIPSDDPATGPGPDATVINVEPCDPGEPGGPEIPIQQPEIPIISCDANGSIYNTGYDHSSDTTHSLGTIDDHWRGSVTSASGPDASTVYGNTYVVGRLAGWASSPFADAEWVSILPGANMGVGTRYVTYRYQFELDSDVDPSQFALEIDYFADDYIVEVYVNGLEQSRHFEDGPEYGASYSTNSYGPGRQARLELDEDWQGGLNSIEILTYNFGTWEGFLAQVRSTQVCPQIDFGDAPESYGGAEHDIVDSVFLGTSVDKEASPQYSVNADGDDAVSDILTDDEDGANVPSVVLPGGNMNLTVWGSKISGSEGHIRAWADWDQNGTFDANELLDFDQDIASNVTAFNRTGAINIPDDAACGQTYVRIRYSLTDNMTATGSYSSGETEDYAVELLCGIVGGTIWEDVDGNGAQNGAEAGLSGVTVAVYDVVSGALVTSTVTAADGWYEFPEVRPGQYDVVVTGYPTGYSQTADPDDELDNETSIEVDALNLETILDFGYRDARFDVTGTVWHDMDGDTHMGGSESGIADVTVKLVGSLGTVETLTDDQGQYTFANTIPGSYQIVVDKSVANSPIADYQTTYDADGAPDGTTAIIVDVAGVIEVDLSVSGLDNLISDAGLRPSGRAKMTSQTTSTFNFGYTQTDVFVDIVDLNDGSVELEQDVTWEVRVGSTGPAEDVSVVIIPPDSVVNLLEDSPSPNPNWYSLSNGPDWSCDYDTEANELTCDWTAGTYPTTELVDSQIITLTMRVPGTFLPNSFTAQADVSTSTIEADSQPNTDSHTTSVAHLWETAAFNGVLGMFTHVQYDEDLIEDNGSIERDLNTTIVNPLQVPISVTFGLTATERPMLTVSHCKADDGSDPDCLRINSDAYISGTIIVREYTIDSMKAVISGTSEAALPNMVDDPITVQLGTSGRSVVNTQAECDALGGDKCLLPYSVIEELDEAGEDISGYAWNGNEYTIINLYTNGGRSIDFPGVTALIADGNAKPGLYRIVGTMSIMIEYDDVRLGSDPYVIEQTIGMETYLRIVAPFVEPED